VRLAFLGSQEISSIHNDFHKTSEKYRQKYKTIKININRTYAKLHHNFRYEFFMVKKLNFQFLEYLKDTIIVIYNNEN
jgi:hypothetical protein